MSLLNLLDCDTRNIIREMKLSMELWDRLKAEHDPITPIEDLTNWDISGEGILSDDELWEQNCKFAYTCAVIAMGESLGLNMEYGTPTEFAYLTENNQVNYRIALECFIAFLELHRTDIREHTFYKNEGIEAMDTADWRYDSDELHNNETLWRLSALPYDWKTKAIEQALSCAVLYVGELKLTPWTIYHLTYVVAHKKVVYSAYRTFDEAKTYARENCSRQKPLCVYRGELGATPQLVGIATRN